MTSASEMYIPVHVAGSQHSVLKSKEFLNKAIAFKKFQAACQYLLNVSEWNSYAKGLGGEFSYTDSDGNECATDVQQGGFIRVKLPGPANPLGNGYDWVVVTQLEKIAGAHSSSLIMLSVPCALPKKTKEGTAHFYAPTASNTFIVTLKDEKVEVGIYGRNEKANIHNAPLTSAVRNGIVALTAKLGFSKIQWELLAEGILKKL